MCNNKASQTIPSGWDYKNVELPCGNTGYYGEPVYCQDCNTKHEAAGRKPYECRHGMDMRPEGAVCSACEWGDD